MDKVKGITKPKMIKLKNLPPEDYHLETLVENKVRRSRSYFTALTMI